MGDYISVIQLIVCDEKLFKLDTKTGQTWLCDDDYDGEPVWIEIKNLEELKEKK